MIRKARPVLHVAIITLLAVATAGTGALWVDSYRDRRILIAEQEEMSKHLQELGFPAPWIGRDVSYEPVPRRIIRVRSCQGRVSVSYHSGDHRARKVTLPIWLLFIGFAAYPMLWITTRGPLRRFRRRKRNRCLKCGYDLTGNASGICPECGTAIVTEDK